MVSLKMLWKSGSLFNLIPFTRFLSYKRQFSLFVPVLVCWPQLAWEINVCVWRFCLFEEPGKSPSPSMAEDAECRK